MTYILTHKRQILKSASIISVITVVSRILGYVRDQRLTLLLGTTGIADSFVLAYRIPNLLRRLVGEGSMTASFIPVFTDYMRNRSREETWKFANRLFWTFSFVLAGLTVLCVVFSPLAVRLFSMFGKSQIQVEAIYLNRLMFPYILFIGMAALAMAILNCFHIFGLPAATPILLNISFIVFSVALVWKHFSSPAAALAVGVLVGGIFQFFLQVPQLVRRGMNFEFGISFTDPGVRRVASLMLPGFLGMGIAQINLLVDTIFANAKIMPEGSLVSLYVADRVPELVLGGYAIAVATAILPMMAHQASAGDHEAMKKTFGFALRIVSFITIPAAVGLVILREPIVQVLFQHGLFVAESCGRLHAPCERSAERDISVLFLSQAPERRPGPGQRAGQLFQRVGAIYGFPFAVRTARDMGHFGIHGKDRYLFCGDGRYMLDDAAVFSFRFDRPLLDSPRHFHRHDWRCYACLSGSCLGVALR